MNKKLIIIIAVALVVIIGAGVGVFMMMNQPKEVKEPEVVFQEYQLPEMYTNIKDEGRILKILISIEYTDAELLSVLESSKSKIINNLYELFRGKDLATLSKPNGQERAREEVKDIVVEILGDKGESVSNVYFLQFIVQ